MGHRNACHKEWCVTKSGVSVSNKLEFPQPPIPESLQYQRVSNKRESRIHQDGDSGILLEMPTSLVVLAATTTLVGIVVLAVLGQNAN